MGVSEAAASGDRGAVLRAALGRLAAEVDVADERVLPGLVRELRAVLSELAEGPAEEADFVDELKARRSGAAGGKRSASG